MDVRDAAAEYRIEPLADVAADDVPAGYQRTEVGVIPEDWCVCSLTQLADVLTGLTYRPTDVADAGVLVLRSSNIQNDRLTYDDNVYVAAAAVPPSVIVRDGDILVCVRNGSRELIGKSAMIREPGTATAFGAFMAVLRAPEPQFAYYVFRSAGVEQQIHEQLGATINQITGAGFKAFLVPYPVDQSERAAIADALSDADALIESLQELIAKQRAIKQGAMRALLTGRQRLPGFGGKWRSVHAGDIGKFRGGNGFPVSIQGRRSGTYPFFKVSDMSNVGNTTIMLHANNYVDEPIRKSLGATVFPAHSIVFAKIGAAIFLERKKILNKPSCIDNNMAGYVLDDAVANYRFIHYVLSGRSFGELANATALPSLGGKALAGIELKLPTLTEQAAIATVLSDMDVAIGALEAHLAKTRALKAGMMQQLLTGRIRLVAKEQAHA